MKIPDGEDPVPGVRGDPAGPPAGLGPASRKPQPRLWVVCLFAAVALVLLDWILVAWVYEPVPSYRVPPASAADMAEGAACRRHSTDPSDYQSFCLHWPLLILAIGTSWAVGRFLGGPRGGALARVAQGVAPVVVLLFMLEVLVIEPRPLNGPFRADPVLLWNHRPHLDGHPAPYLRTDADGFRESPFAPPGGPLVVLLGDSTTYGVRVGEVSNTYAWVLSRELQARLPCPPRVLNRGVPGFTSWQGVQMLRLVLEQHRPRVVVAAFMANDWTPAVIPDRALELPRPLLLLRRVLWRSNVYVGLRRGLRVLMRSASPDDAGEPVPAGAGPRVPVQDFEANLEEIRRLCVQNECRLVVVALPMAPSLDRVSAPYREVVARVGRQPGVSVLDLHALWRVTGDNLRDFDASDPIHPNGPGHHRIGLRLATHLLPLLGGGAPAR